jgi:hypothetical protein
MGTRGFKSEFLAHYAIKNFLRPDIKGEQKSVHFIERNGQNQVMKIFDREKISVLKEK